MDGIINVGTQHRQTLRVRKAKRVSLSYRTDADEQRMRTATSPAIECEAQSTFEFEKIISAE